MVYDPNISYCGSWTGNAIRTKLKLQEKLPFNSCCYAHDCDYNFLFNVNLNITRKLILKAFIDWNFLKNMIKVSKFYQLPIAFIFYGIVTIFTPIYFFRFRKSA
jgi:hypothetical protein